ncbi:serine/threonine-protein phosphatase, partial [Micromonospora sp. NPDC005324]
MSSLESLRQLLQQSHHARPDDLPEMAMRAAPLLDARALVIYLVDHQQRLLLPLIGGSAPARDPIDIDGT